MRLNNKSGISRRAFMAGSAALGALALTGISNSFAEEFNIPEPIGDLTADGSFRWIDSGDQKAVFYKAFFNKYDEMRGITTVYDGLPWQEIATIVPLGIRNGTAHDVITLPISVSPGFAVSEGWVQPFDDLIPDFEAWKSNFPAGAFLEGVNIFDGKTYGLPYTSGKVSSAHVLFNRALMSEAGYDPETTPLTWTTFREAARKITEAGQGRAYGFIIGGAQINRWADSTRAIAQMAGASGGSNSFYEDLDMRTGELQYDSDEYIGAVELLLALQADGSVFPGVMGLNAPQARAFMPQGVAGMILQGPWNVPQWERENPDFDFGIAPPPVPDEGPVSNLIADAVASPGNTVYINAASKNPQIAADVFRYLGTEQGQTDWGSIVGPSDPPVFPAAIAQATMSDRAKAILLMASEIIRVGPNPFVRNPELSEVAKVYQDATPSFAQTVQGLFSGQLSGVKENMELLKSNRNKAIDAAFEQAKAAGANVSRDDLIFPNWVPENDYSDDDYKAL